MSYSLLFLVFGGTVVIAHILAGLGVLVFRETRRALAFDRRLGVPRERALKIAPRSEDGGRGSGAGTGARKPGRALLRAASMLVPVGARERARLADMLRGAGFGQPDALTHYLCAKLGVGAVFAAGAGYFAQASELMGRSGLLIAFAVLMGFVIGGILPEYGLRALTARRIQRMTTALPDALDLMVMCLESGLTFERALATVAEELTPIEPNLAAEFRLIEAELRLGANRRAVLQEFHRRTEVEGLKDLATTLIQSERYGTPLTQSMRNIAAAERVQRAARIAAQTERLPVLMTLPLLLFVVPGTMLLVAGPAFLSATKALQSLGGG